jgi:hypothetical protein
MHFAAGPPCEARRRRGMPSRMKASLFKRCPQCHAHAALTRARDMPYPGGCGSLQASVELLLDPRYTWELCQPHRSARARARAELDRQLTAQVDADQRTWEAAQRESK